MNENSFDENNLLYVRKTYETDVTEKARRIFADNTVQTTLDETNKKLDELIAEMNAKLGFVNQKMNGENGIEEFVKDVHREIDNTAVDSAKLVDSGIIGSGSHPSVTTFKNSRSETKYKTYDFINKNIDIGFKEQALRFYNNTDIKDDDKIHTFNIHMEDVERLKIVEFAFTYSQFPEIVKILEGNVYKEPTTRINRVFSGRFYIIRHDPINAPDEIIVKAVVENADNNGNVVDEYSIDVKKTNIEDKLALKNELGPTFDIYFRIASRSELMICIGNINPYKYMLQKNYVETNKQIVDNFNLVKSGINGVNFDNVIYSENMQKMFVIDKLVNRIYMLPAIDKNTIDNITVDNSMIYDKLSTDGFFIKDVGSYTFIGDKSEHCLVYTKGNTVDYVDLNVMVEDVQLMSTNEIIVQVGSILNGRKISRLYMFNYSSTSLNNIIFGEFHTSTSNINFVQQNKFMEYEPGKIILVSNSKDGTIYYKFLRFNVTTNTYTNEAAESATIEQKIEIDELKNFDPDNTGTEMNIIRSETGLFIHINSNSTTNGSLTTIVSARNLNINVSTFTFKDIEIIKKYDVKTKLSYQLTDIIKKIIPTSLLTFGISEENKLFIIDDKYILEALNFESVEENGEIKGFTDKHSILYMKPIEGEQEYYLTDKPYLQNVKAIYESYKGNIYILDGKGVYELTTSKNLICKFWTDEELFTDVVVNRATDAYIISSKNGKQNIFHQVFDIDESSTKKLRHKYFDLVNGDYLRYDPEEDYSNFKMDEDDVMIDFKAILYCTLIDRMSSLYNSKDTNNMYYTDRYVFNDINPVKPHNVNIEINGENVMRNIPITKFSLSTNKYGFVNYYGFTLLDTSNLSNINDENLYVLVHKTGDNLTINDYRQVIYKLIKEQTLKENDKYDENGNLKPGFETTITVSKTYKPDVKINRFDFNTAGFDGIDTDNITKNKSKLLGSLLSDGMSYIYRDKLYTIAKYDPEFTDIDTEHNSCEAEKLPISFLNSFDNDKYKVGKRIDPFDVQYNNINYFVGYYNAGLPPSEGEVFYTDENIKLGIVREEPFKTENDSNNVGPATTLVKSIDNVIAARAINNELWYSKSTGGLFYLDDQMNEVEKVSPNLGYVFYDFTSINGEIYGITNTSLLVKINKDNPDVFPEVIINESNVLSSYSGEGWIVNADIYNFNSSDKLILRVMFISEKKYDPDTDSQEPDNYMPMFMPYLFVVDKDNLTKYRTIQKPSKMTYIDWDGNVIAYINEDDGDNYYEPHEQLILRALPNFVYTFVEINNTIYANGSQLYKFDPKTLIFDNIECSRSTFKKSNPVDENESSDEDNVKYTNADLYRNDDHGSLKHMIKTPYNSCLLVKTYWPEYDTNECFFKYADIIVDNNYRDEKILLGDENSISETSNRFEANGCIFNYSSNKVSSGKKYNIAVKDRGVISINDIDVKRNDAFGNEQKLGNTFTVKDVNPIVYKSSVKIVQDTVSGEYSIVDPTTNEPVNLFKLDHKRCAWNSLSFKTTKTVGSLVEKGIIPYKYKIDDTNKFVKVDTSVIKYPIPGITYYTKTVVGNHDVYNEVSSNIKKWEVTSAGNTEYYEVSHHYEQMTTLTDFIPAGDYVFVCENKYFSLANLNITSEGVTNLPLSEEYYLLENATTTVNLEKVKDERSAFILNDDRILMTAKVNNYYKTIIYDTYRENDFTRHDIWDQVYPKAGFNIRRIWETSRGKFAVINIPCYESMFLAFVSDDLQHIWCKLDYDIVDPGCVHIVDTEKELTISIANQYYSNVECYKYDSNLNTFVRTNESLIYIDSVKVDGKTYIAAIKNTINVSDTKDTLGLFILDENKNVVLNMGTGKVVPLYCTNRNPVKQFDNVFVKRLNSNTNREEAFVFFGMNVSNNPNNTDNLHDCIHITRAGVQLKDLNLLGYTKLGMVNGTSIFSNVILDPENNILLVCNYSGILSFDENEKISLIKGSNFIYHSKAYDENPHEVQREKSLIFTTSYLNNMGYHKYIANSHSVDDTENVPYPFNWYYYSPVCNNYIKVIESDGGKIRYGITNKLHKNNSFVEIKYGNSSDVSNTLFKNIHYVNPLDRDMVDRKTDAENFKELKQPLILLKQKILPVKYKNTLIFGTSVVDDKTGKPSSNYFSIYDSDKKTLISDYFCFDYLFVTKSGKMFGVYETSIYENDDVLSSTKWFKVKGGTACEYGYLGDSLIVINSFKKMVENDFGIFYFDSKNILKYNEEEDKFDAVEHQFDLTTGTLNFAENFHTGLFIGYKRDPEFELAFDSYYYREKYNEYNQEETDVVLPTKDQIYSYGINFNYYDPKQNAFISLLPDSILTSVSKMDKSMIVDIKETSQGVFILYYAADDTYKNTIFRVYTSIHNLILWEECKYKQTFTLLDGNKYENNYPCNHSQIWEDTTTDTIWILGSVYGIYSERFPLKENTIGRYMGAWAYRKYIENDNGNYRHNHGNDYRFEPNIPTTSLKETEYTENDPFIYTRTYKNSKFAHYNGTERIIDTKHFGTFAEKHLMDVMFGEAHYRNDADSSSPFYYLSPFIIGKVNSIGENNDIKSMSSFTYVPELKYKRSDISFLNVPYLTGCTKIKEIGDKLFCIVYDYNIYIGANDRSMDDRYIHQRSYGYSNKLYIFEYKDGEDGKKHWYPVNYNYYSKVPMEKLINEYETIINNTSYYDPRPIFDECYYGKTSKYGLDIMEHNGIVYLKESVDSDICIVGDNKLVGVESSPESISNNVLYELRAVVDNQSKYNNLVEKTDNSNLDKFVFKEVGIIDGLTGETKHIFQYFEPNEYYNEVDGIVKPLIEKPREFVKSDTIKQLYKDVYQKFKKKNLINNRYIKPGQNLIADGFKHEVKQILGDMEDYLINTDNVRIELKIYPSEVEDYVDNLNIPCEFGTTTNPSDDESGIGPFDPYD